MLEYYKIDISEGIDINKTNASKECDIPMMLLLPLLKGMIIEFTFGI